MDDIPCEMASSLTFLKPHNDGGSWEHLIDSWFYKRPVEERNYLIGVTRNHVDKCIEYLQNDQKHLPDGFHLHNYNSTQNMLKIFDVSSTYGALLPTAGPRAKVM